ncbi:oxidoreductase [Xylogone sp. PMI_703]|nr:oxidoreductase [Xylogone sp. PMI_703]
MAESKPAQNSNKEESLEELKAILANQTHLFACGGRVPIAGFPSETASQSSDIDEQRRSPPVTIRWDTPGTADDQTTPAKLTLPLAPEADMLRLFQHSQPATFGRGGQDVYDESYRKALKMDPTNFCTTFDPYSLGSIDAGAQVLLPSVIDSTTCRAVRAELYKLNASPSGKFKPHVDTPRSSSQFGSLVICLPVKHEGGQLLTPQFSGPLFYSDCKHEVLEVTGGHRLTLTYNLYAVRGAGRLTGVSPTLDPAQLPLFHAIKNILIQDPFDGQGGMLGFWCSHVYAYNHNGETPLPDTLKGVDAVLWEIFQSLNLHPQIAPIIVRDGDGNMYEESEPYSEDSGKTSPWVIGRKFGLKGTSGTVETWDDYDRILKGWGNFSSQPIRWLTQPADSELQIVHLAYGNDTSTDTIYSRCAILMAFPRE